MGYMRGEAPGQSSLFPPSLDELVPADHPVRVIGAYVGSLDLGTLGFERTTPAATGRPGYDPADLLKLYLYGYLNRVRSSRRLETECQRNVEVMWLLGRLAPDFKTIADFRRINGQGFVQVCRSFVRFCRDANLLGAELVAIDGSKFQAASARRRVVTAATLDRDSRKLDERIAGYLKILDEADRQERAEPIDRKAVRAALAKLRERQADCQTAQEVMKELGDTQHVTGESDARLMSNGHSQTVAYNVQSAVDEKHGLIVHHEVTSIGTDSAQLEPTAKAAKEVLGVDTLKVVADTGYSNGTQFAACEEAGITPFVPAMRRYEGTNKGDFYTFERFQYEANTDSYRCPAGKVLMFSSIKQDKRLRRYFASTGDCAQCPQKERCTPGARRSIARHMHEDAFERMKQRLAAAPDMMKRRRSTVEHPFAQLKCGVMGNGRFLLRGLTGAKTEMALAVLARNLKRVMNILGNEALMMRIARI
jgi:transposase